MVTDLIDELEPTQQGINQQSRTQWEIVISFPTKNLLRSWPLIIYFSFMHDAVRFNQNIGVHQNYVLTKHKCVFLDIKRRRTP